MVYKQVILYLLIIFVSYGCNKRKLEIKHNKDIILYTSEKNDKYCLKTILDSLNEHKYLDSNKYYNVNKKESIDNFYEKDYYSKSIDDFYLYNSFVEIYLLENLNAKYLILIGQARGATGIGVDYWNYECLLLTEKSNIIKFSSLSKSPFSIYFNEKEELCYLEVLDNYPRPANGEEIQLDYYPIIAKLVKENGEVVGRIEYNCK